VLRIYFYKVKKDTKSGLLVKFWSKLQLAEKRIKLLNLRELSFETDFSKIIKISLDLSLCHKLWFSNPQSLQPNVVDIINLKLWILLIIITIYQKSTSGCNDLGIGNLFCGKDSIPLNKKNVKMAFQTQIS